MYKSVHYPGGRDHSGGGAHPKQFDERGKKTDCTEFTCTMQVIQRKKAYEESIFIHECEPGQTIAIWAAIPCVSA